MGSVEERGERKSSSQERCRTLLSFLFTSCLLSLCSGRRVITLCLSSTVFSLAHDKVKLPTEHDAECLFSMTFLEQCG